MLKMIRRLMSNTEPKRVLLTEKIYRLCCDYGCLNSLILQQIQLLLLLLLSDDDTAKIDGKSKNDTTISTINEFILRDQHQQYRNIL